MLPRGVFFVFFLASALLVDPRFLEADKPIFRAAPKGALTQLDGENGCVDDQGRERCADGRALDGPADVAVSRDGNSVYVASVLGDAVVAFARDRKSGALTQLDGEDGCVDNDGDEGCANGRALDGATGVTVSRDGRSVYVASRNGGAVAVFARDRRTGALTQLDGEGGCVDNDGDEACTDGRALQRPQRVVVSPDGRSVYVSSVGAVAVFARDRRTGALTQLDGEDGCVDNLGREGCADGRALNQPQGVAVSRDGRSVYVSSVGAVAVFARDRRTGALTQLDGEDGCVDDLGREGCADGRALSNAVDVAVSPDGKSVYVVYALSDAVAVFARDRKSGALTQLDGEDGCVDNDGDEGCAGGRALDGPVGVVVSRDGKSVYIASDLSGAVAVFARDRRTGALTQLDGEDGCVDNDGDEGCAEGRALATPKDVAMSQADKNVYVVSEIGGNGAVAVFARHRKLH